MMTSSVCQTTSIRRGFTLIELLVVIAMIAIFMAAIGVSVGQTRERARIEKAKSEVKLIAQAILAWENYSDERKLEDSGGFKEADSGSLSFLLGGDSSASGRIPNMLMAQLAAGGKMRDPWGMPYTFRIKEGKIDSPDNLNLSTCYYLPNFYRLSAEERK